jgi:hypothetical protein
MPESVDAMGMICLRGEGYTGFLMNSRGETIWAFPETNEGLRKVRYLACKEDD